METNIKGLYTLEYGYSDHVLYFTLTREDFEKVKEIGEISLETSKHNSEEVDLSQIQLVTEDQDFINKFEDFGLTSRFDPIDYLDIE